MAAWLYLQLKESKLRLLFESVSGNLNEGGIFISSSIKVLDVKTLLTRSIIKNEATETERIFFFFIFIPGFFTKSDFSDFTIIVFSFNNGALKFNGNLPFAI